MPKKRRSSISHYNTLNAPVELDGTAQSIKNEFARRLESKRIEKDWNQSDLARFASEYLPKPAKGRARKIGRDQISHYTRGVSLPRPETLRALATQIVSLLAEEDTPKGGGGPTKLVMLLDGAAEAG
jgi:transcriptional regulator with XRE-family HTH domain